MILGICLFDTDDNISQLCSKSSNILAQSLCFTFITCFNSL